MALTEQLVRRAETAGYKALVVTVDSPELGNKLANTRNDWQLPKGLSVPNVSSYVPKIQPGQEMKKYINSLFNPSATWANVDWLRGLTDLPILLKGILTAEDAEEACRHNCRGSSCPTTGADSWTECQPP